MSNTAKASITINVPASDVWNALTDPAVIKQYMFGTDTTSDWKKGSSVVYRGEWEGKPYEDRGTILEIEPEKSIVMDYYSSFSPDTDTAKNRRISYALESNGHTTTLTVTQGNNPDKASAEESTNNWQYILQTMKQLLEK
jgi:uncharacterized protein YndB with AHSA1/START domain